MNRTIPDSAEIVRGPEPGDYCGGEITANKTITLTINLDPAVNPPPQAAPVNSVTVGTIAGSNRVHVSLTQVTATIVIPGGASPGLQTVTVVFPGPPENPSATVTYTLPNGFTIQ